MPSPSPRIVPSASAANGRASPVGDRAGVLLKHMYMKMSLNVSTPPVTTTSQRPDCKLERGQVHRAQRTGAGGIDDAVGAVQIQADWRCARRRRCRASPGNEFSCQPTYDSPMRSTTSSICVIRHAGIFQCLPPLRMAEPSAERDDQFQGARDAENHLTCMESSCSRGWRSGLTEPATMAPGHSRVVQRHLRRDEPEKLRRVGRFEIVGSDAEFAGREGVRIEEPAALGIGDDPAVSGRRRSNLPASSAWPESA